MKALHDEVFELNRRIARAVQALLPQGFRGRFQIVVDNGVCVSHNVSVEFREPQPKGRVAREQHDVG